MKVSKNLFPNCSKHSLFFSISILLLVSFYDTSAQHIKGSTQFEINLRNAEKNLEAIGIDYYTSTSRLQNTNQTYANIQGTPYLHKEWVNGDIHLVSGYVHKKVKVKLDIYNDMILYQGSAGLIALHKDYIQEFILDLGGTQQIFEKINISGKENTFYEIIYDGPTRLLKYYQKELIKTNTEASYGDNKNDEFVNRDIYFLGFRKGKYEKIKLNKASILKNLPDNGKDLKGYLKNAVVDLRDEKAIVDLLNFYDSN